MFGEDDVDGARIFLERLAAAGVSSVGVYWDPGYRLRERLEEWAPRLPDGLAVTLRPEAAPFTDWQSRWDRTSRPWSKGPAVRGGSFHGRVRSGVSRSDPLWRLGFQPTLFICRGWSSPVNGAWRNWRGGSRTV
jgi:hypothetical protein